MLIVSPETLGHGASSGWAQAGVAAAIDPADSPEAHASDTLRVGAGLVDAAVARLVAAAARGLILDLARLGAPFDRTGSGDYVLSREAAQGVAEVARVKGDQAGAEIMRALTMAVCETSSVQVLEGVLTTNLERIPGQGIGLSARVGDVTSYAEFVQFHPTAVDVALDPAPLATEALRGEGAYLVNAHGEGFMLPLHPHAELATRDTVARAVYLQSQAGLRPALETRACPGRAS